VKETGRGKVLDSHSSVPFVWEWRTQQ